MPYSLDVFNMCQDQEGFVLPNSELRVSVNSWAKAEQNASMFKSTQNAYNGREETSEGIMLKTKNDSANVALDLILGIHTKLKGCLTFWSWSVYIELMKCCMQN